jgi:hypothetical protein
MMQTTSRILKSSDVEVEGQFHLDLGHPAQSAPNNKNAAAIPKVRIIENQNEFAVVEVICSCGRKTVVRCEYGNAAAANTLPRPEQNGAAGHTSEKKL